MSRHPKQSSSVFALNDSTSDDNDHVTRPKEHGRLPLLTPSHPYSRVKTNKDLRTPKEHRKQQQILGKTNLKTNQNSKPTGHFRKKEAPQDFPIAPGGNLAPLWRSTLTSLSPGGEFSRSGVRAFVRSVC